MESAEGESNLTAFRAETRSATTLVMIVMSFLLCWTPVCVSYFVIALTGDRSADQNILNIYTIVLHLNATLDPIIYAFRVKDIQKAFRRLMLMK